MSEQLQSPSPTNPGGPEEGQMGSIPALFVLHYTAAGATVQRPPQQRAQTHTTTGDSATRALVLTEHYVGPVTWPRGIPYSLHNWSHFMLVIGNPPGGSVRQKVK